MQEIQQNEQQSEGLTLKRRTMITTGVTGTGGTFIALASHGPLGLFVGGLATAVALALEYHGNEAEYMAISRFVAPGVRIFTRAVRRGSSKALPQPKDARETCVTLEKTEQLTVTQADDEPMEALQEKPKRLPPMPRTSEVRMPEFDLSDEEMDEGIAHLMVGNRYEEVQEETINSAIIGTNPRRRLNMAENFQPDANDPLATGVAAFGIPGSGKTTAIIRMFEQYVEQYRLPFVAFDSQGDWKSLVESGFCPRGVIATPDTLPAMSAVVLKGLQVVVDLQEWREEGAEEMSIEMAAQVITSCIRGLMAAQRVIASHDRVSCLVGLDEAQLWVPEGSSGFMTKATGAQIKTAVMGLATTGRKLGVVPFVAGPRIAQIDKDAIAGIETRLFGKADLDNDIKRYRDYIPVREISDQQIRQLGKGDLIVSMNGQRILAHFYNRMTKHISHTPRVSQSLARFATTLPPETLAQITQVRQTDALPATPRRRVPMSAQEAHRQRIEARKRPVYARQEERVVATVPVATVDEALERGKEVYQAGYVTLDKFCAAMGYQKLNQGRLLWSRVKIAMEEREG